MCISDGFSDVKSKTHTQNNWIQVNKYTLELNVASNE